MTNNQTNKAVAIELGWTSIRDEPSIWELEQSGIAPGDSESSRKDIPNFCEDHNAVAEMREALKFAERVDFSVKLMRMVGHGYFDMLNATPRQQCEAFLRMRGKWFDHIPEDRKMV